VDRQRNTWSSDSHCATYRRLPDGDVGKFHIANHIIYKLLEGNGLEWDEIRRVMRLIPKGKLVDLIEASSFEAVAEDLAKKKAP
jgi:2-phosphoglycerate kinase